MFWHRFKLIFWIITPIILGIFLASFLFTFFEQNKFKATPQEANTSAIVKIIEKTPEVVDPDFLKLVFAGDIMLDRGVRASVVKNLSGDYAQLFKNLEILKDADIAFANLEGTASDKGRDKHNLYSFRMDPMVIPILKNAGIDIVSVANNHIGDWGVSAFVDTLARLKEAGVLYTGGGDNKERAEAPTIIEKYGIKIGFLGFSDVGPDSMKAGIDNAGILLARDPRFNEIIEKASRHVDYLVVSFHFGDEYKPIHNKRQEYLAHKAIDAGAKIVIGHHPHVEEDTEIYKNGYIAYSLGNFIFDQSWSEPTMKSILLNLKLYKDGSIVERKDAFKLNKFFQPGDIVEGEEKEIKF